MCVSVCVLDPHSDSQQAAVTGRPIITDTAPAFQSPPLLFLLPLSWKEEKVKKEEVQIIENPCFDALSSLLCCCLNMSLFCPPSPPAPPHFLLQPQSLSLICKCCLSLYLSLSQTILDCGGESASLSACRNFLATYIIHVCL